MSKRIILICDGCGTPNQKLRKIKIRMKYHDGEKIVHYKADHLCFTCSTELKNYFDEVFLNFEVKNVVA